ncbi:MAG: YqeG family HAD IIIA-type phosphatase [Eubacteriales bacterium]|nr:YqeG family HAD IIIA-type phosphatase [Eubacteriales bacterium]
MRHIIEENFKPDACYAGLDRIQFAGLYRRGYRLALLDLDNTLSAHGSHEADDYARQCVERIHNAGMTCWIITNAARKRGEAYARSLGIPVIAMAGKPNRRGVRQACEATGFTEEQTFLAGDQLLTDIWCARRSGCLAILVEPRFKEEAWNIRMKRWLEKPLFHRFHLCRVSVGNGAAAEKWREIDA